MSAVAKPAVRSGLGALEVMLLGACFALLVLAVLAQANPAVMGVDRDSGFYLYIGNTILHGKLPYRDAWESKPPAIFYLNALALWLGRGSRWGIWALEAFCLLAAMYLAFGIMRQLWGPIPALFGVLLLAYGFERTFENGNFTEEYPLPLHFLAITLFMGTREQPRRAANAALGALFAICFLFRPNNALPEAALIVALAADALWRRELRGLARQLGWIVLGASIPILITAAYFWTQGLLGELLDASILYNLTYSGTEITASSPLEVGLRAFGAPILAVAAIGYGIGLAWLMRGDARRPIYLFLLLGAPMAILLSDPARRNYLHYYLNWLPFIALLGALALHFVMDRWAPGVLNSGRAALVAIGVTAVAALTVAAWGGAAADLQKALGRFANRSQSGIEYLPPVAEYVNEHTKPADTVLFWGADPGFNFLSKRQSPSSVLFYPLFVPSPISERLEERFLADLTGKPPALVVDMGESRALSLDGVERSKQLAAGLGWRYLPANIDQVFGFIAQHYALAAKVSGHAVYSWKAQGQVTEPCGNCP